MNTNTFCVGSFNSSCSGFLQLKNDGHASRLKEKVNLCLSFSPLTTLSYGVGCVLENLASSPI